MIKSLEHMKSTLMNCVQGQLGDLSSIDSKELGEAIDMIKDLSEAIYYCTITESMNKKDEESKYYPIAMDTYRYYYDRDMDRGMGRMYYDGNGTSTSRNYPYKEYPVELRDYREGQSPLTRKTYMERKMHGGDKVAQMHELEKYMQELSHDLTEMIEGASPEEKQMLSKKLTALATKVV